MFSNIRKYYSDRTHQAQLLVIGVSFYVLVYLDVFGVGQTSRELSHQMTSKLMAPYYPDSPDLISVIAIDDNASEYYPVSYQLYADLFLALAVQKPRAIFLDINIQKREDTTYKQYLMDVLEMAKDNEIPMYAPVDNSTDTDISQFFQAVGIKWQGFLDFYPVADNQGVATAAFQIYSDLFNNEFDGSHPMFIYWPLAVNSSSLLKKIYVSLSSLFDSNENAYIKHQYFSTYAIGQFLSYPRANQEEIVTDKIVFIGNTMKLSNDYIVSPIYGQTPGVFLHVTALDNLIKFDSKYYKDESSGAIFGVGISSLLEWLVLILNGLTLVCYEQWKTEHKRSVKNRLKKSFYGLIFTVLTIVIALILTLWVFRTDPGNFIGLLAINGFIYEFLTELIKLFLNFISPIRNRRTL